MPTTPAVADFALTVVLPPDEFEALAQRVADLLNDGRDDGFLDAEAAAKYLGLSRKAIYHLVERKRLPHHRPAGRLLFDRAELRAWVQGDR
jgi:excisionase family DNA binding protein